MYSSHLVKDHNVLVISLLHDIIVCNGIGTNALFDMLSTSIKCFIRMCGQV